MKTIINLLMFILFPLVMIAIITAYIKDKPTDIYAVTNLKGLVLIQYQHRYPVKSGRDVGETYEMSSNWIPLTGDPVRAHFICFADIATAFNRIPVKHMK